MTKEEITQMRESLSLTKKELASKLGITSMLLGRYESGSCRIPEHIIEKLNSLITPLSEEETTEAVSAEANEEEAAFTEAEEKNNETAATEAAEENVAALIKSVRESLSLSKSAFAKMIGVSASAAGNYEAGRNKPREEILEKIRGLIKKETDADPVDEEIAASPVEEEIETEDAADEEAAGVSAEEEMETEDAVAEEAAWPVEEKMETVDEAVEETDIAPVEVEKKSRKKQSASRRKKQTSIVIESMMGGSITAEEVLSRIPSDADTVYIKPGENAAYWVKGQENGSVKLW